MRKNLKDTRTEYNLRMAFTAESRNVQRYQYFANQAGSDCTTVQSVLLEKIQAECDINAQKQFAFMISNGNDIHTGEVAQTREQQLAIAIKSQKHMAQDVYPGMAEEARYEGFYEVAEMFDAMSKQAALHVETLENLFKSVK